MSHELRTPLNPILGFSELLLEEIEGEEQKDILRMIVRAGEDLTKTIDDVLDFAKIEAGRMDLFPEPFSLEAFVEDEMNLMSGQSSNKKVHLRTEVDHGELGPELPEFLGDLTKMRRVLRNLIGNALKFTTEGRVELTVCFPAVSERHVQACFRVADSGIGIAPENLKALFTPFFQIDGSTTRKYGGSGLGLAICKRLTELMEGTLEVESEPGKGSVFSFTIPLEINSEGADARETDYNGAREEAIRLEGAPLILLVEDNRSNVCFMKKILQKIGCRVEVAGNGDEALERFDPSRHKAVLLDLQMPGLGGMDVLRSIRREEASSGRYPIPIIVVTANVLKATRDECFANGATGFLAKPVHVNAVRTALSECLVPIGN